MLSTRVKNFIESRFFDEHGEEMTLRRVSTSDTNDFDEEITSTAEETVITGIPFKTEAQFRFINQGAGPQRTSSGNIMVKADVDVDEGDGISYRAGDFEVTEIDEHVYKGSVVAKTLQVT